MSLSIFPHTKPQGERRIRTWERDIVGRCGDGELDPNDPSAMKERSRARTLARDVWSGAFGSRSRRLSQETQGTGTLVAAEVLHRPDTPALRHLAERCSHTQGGQQVSKQAIREWLGLCDTDDRLGLTYKQAKMLGLASRLAKPYKHVVKRLFFDTMGVNI